MNLKLGCGFKDFGQMIATKPPVGHPKMCLSYGTLPKNADKGIIGKFAQIMLPTQTNKGNPSNYYIFVMFDHPKMGN